MKETDQSILENLSFFFGNSLLYLQVLIPVLTPK